MGQDGTKVNPPPPQSKLQHSGKGAGGEEINEVVKRKNGSNLGDGHLSQERIRSNKNMKLPYNEGNPWFI